MNRAALATPKPRNSLLGCMCPSSLDSAFSHLSPLCPIRPLNVLVWRDHAERIPWRRFAQGNRARNFRVAPAVLTLELDFVPFLSDREGLTGLAWGWLRFASIRAGEVRQRFVGPSVP